MSKRPSALPPGSYSDSFSDSRFSDSDSVVSDTDLTRYHRRSSTPHLDAAKRRRGSWMPHLPSAGRVNGEESTDDLWRHRVEKVVESPKLQILVMLLLIVDIIVVTFLVLVSTYLNLLYFVDDDLREPVKYGMRIASLTILAVFEFELLLMVYCWRSQFFCGSEHHSSFWLNIDFVIVTTSLVVEIVYFGTDVGEIPSLLMLVRLPWRVLRIMWSLMEVNILGADDAHVSRRSANEDDAEDDVMADKDAIKRLRSENEQMRRLLERLGAR